MARPWARVRAVLPAGHRLTDDAWQGRHRAILALVALLGAGIPLAPGHAGHHHGSTVRLVDALPVLVLALAAWTYRHRHALASGLATAALLSAAATYVALTGGVIEAHFLFFVCLGVITLYQDWWPFLLAVAFTLVHHATLGLLDPSGVFNHQAAIDHPLRWTVVHTTFIVAASVVNVVAWKANENHLLRDPLTGLDNRTVLAERMAARIGAEELDALLFIDLCGFKHVNDSLGHDAGDRVLAAVADRLRAAVAGEGHATRFGGDEFAVLLPGADEVQARAVADRILEALRQPCAVGGIELHPAASIGIALRSPSIEDVPTLLRNADLAMYAAKRAGGGGGAVAMFSPELERAAGDRLALESDLRRAVERDELRLHYQPIVDLDTGRVEGFEALLRWAHPRRGLVPPAAFVPVAEETGLMVEIGRWVLREATHQLAAWRTTPGAGRLTMSVNVSSVQVARPGLVADVADALLAARLEPAALILEITESALIDAGAPQVLTELKALGVRLALDDFGTGYSSLAYLGRLPVDVLKVDKAFVDAVPDGASASLTAGVLALAEQIGVITVVEGVERASQVLPLLAMGARLAQGFLFHRPLPVEAATALVRSLPRAGTKAWAADAALDDPLYGTPVGLFT